MVDVTKRTQHTFAVDRCPLLKMEYLLSAEHTFRLMLWRFVAPVGSPAARVERTRLFLPRLRCGSPRRPL